jgi:Mn2+/Fe2+ NRAMP family transporter
MKALSWSAVINGVVPVLAVLMVILSRRDVMREFVAPRHLKIFGWSATFIMAAAAVAMIVVLG